MRLFFLLAIIQAILAGCGVEKTRAENDVVFFVPGVGGNVGYGGLISALRAPDRPVRIINWGAPTPLFVLNFNSKSIHENAEIEFVNVLKEWRASHPASRIELVGHSAGCGVIVGGLSRLPDDFHVDHVVLLAADLSPTYDLRAALARIDGRLDSFHSPRDKFFLQGLAKRGGTYDNVKTEAAGSAGFVGEYPNEKFVQHPYDPNWQSLGNGGGHFGCVDKKFVKTIVAPLLDLSRSPSGRGPE